MEDSNLKTHIALKEDVSTRSLAGSDSSRLGSFFDLLLQIDKRNHPELYEHNQSGASPYQTSERLDRICVRGD